MSNLPTITVGNSHKGIVKGKVNFTGKSNVETSGVHNYNIGGNTDGEVDENAVIVFNETNTITAAKEQNAVHNEQQEPDKSEVKKYQLNDELNGNSIKIKGHMTIFNQDFKGTHQFRRGSDKDVESLCDTFRRFGIEPTVKPSDLNYKDIVTAINTLSKTNFSDYKLFVCVLMTHGDKKGIVSVADKEFNLHETIINPIMGNRTLNGIAKIFITVACRGYNNYYECDGEECDGTIRSDKNGIDYSNCIISYSTYEGHVSKRTESGTYFIQELCKHINEDNGQAKIHSYFARVNDSLTRMYKQVPEFQSTMGDISFKDLASTS